MELAARLVACEREKAEALALVREAKVRAEAAEARAARAEERAVQLAKEQPRGFLLSAVKEREARLEQVRAVLCFAVSAFAASASIFASIFALYLSINRFYYVFISMSYLSIYLSITHTLTRSIHPIYLR